MNTAEGSRRHRRRRHRHRRNERLKQSAAIVVITLLVLATVALVAWPLWKSTSPSVAVDETPDSASIELASVGTTGPGASRPIYKYSVIPGGARNSQELAEAIGRDPVVAAHYRAVSPDRVRVERLPETRQAYVSYRVGDRVYWTKHMVTLPAGELILTDGVTQIRARCGNCISDKPQLPTSGDEPESAELDTQAPAELPPGQAFPGSVVAWNEGTTGSSELSASLLTNDPRLLDRRATVLALDSAVGNADQNRFPRSLAPPVVGFGGHLDGLHDFPTGGLVSDAGGSVSDSANQGEAIGGPEGSTPNGSTHDGSSPGGSTPGGSTPGASTPGGSGSGGSAPDGWTPGGSILDESTRDGFAPGEVPEWLFPEDDRHPGGYTPGDPLPDSPGLKFDDGFPSGDEGDSSALITDEPLAPVPVPEPGTLCLLGSGVVGALWRRRRARRLKSSESAQSPQ